MLAAFCVAYLLGSMARERIVLKLQRDALTDPLTEVANRRAFFEQGERLFRRARQGRQQIAVLAFDLDQFKAINDRFGHHAGDRVLRMFCDVATGSLRPGDLFGRIGGEEFACVLPNASHEGGMQVAERIRARFAALDVIVDGTAIDATVSAGVASSGDQELSLSRLIAAADRALYEAKEHGRNRVELARSHPSGLVSLVPQDELCDFRRASRRSARVK
jgi:diguanylate cyclase (GGDEF)-like protein